jgi:sulfoxide reductase catalytic subunit YedY
MMLVRKSSELKYSEITPKRIYMNRRNFITATSLAVAGVTVGSKLLEMAWPGLAAQAGTKLTVATKSSFSTSEAPTAYKDVTTYNNYYEFGTAKEDPSKNAHTLRTSPWTVSVEGEVKKKRTFDLDGLMKLAPLEERIFRHRCVEAWSIVVPWIGIPLSALIKEFELTPKAHYVAFQSLYDPQQMPLGRNAGIELPYVEGLRLDEAMHPLATLCFGMFGETLPNQDGAPVRLVVPWKYGFKSIKSIVKIKFVEKQPPSTWNITNAHEYGFYSNVNPSVDHPRWSQASERRLGEFRRRKTLMFNGYGDQVAQLYSGMDLIKNY